MLTFAAQTLGVFESALTPVVDGEECWISDIGISIDGETIRVTPQSALISIAKSGNPWLEGESLCFPVGKQTVIRFAGEGRRLVLAHSPDHPEVFSVFEEKAEG